MMYLQLGEEIAWQERQGLISLQSAPKGFLYQPKYLLRFQT